MTTTQTPAAVAEGEGPARPRAQLVIRVHGQPKPKGSMRHVGNGRMVEQLEGSKPWRVAVVEATRTVMDRTFGPKLLALREAPVFVEATITVDRPKGHYRTGRNAQLLTLAAPPYPVTRTSGDSDKHARNLLDALVDAGLIRDDSQVVDITVRKRYPGTHDDCLDTPGAVIRVSAVA